MLCTSASYATRDAATNATANAWWRHAGDDENDDARPRRGPSGNGRNAAYVPLFCLMLESLTILGMMSQMGGGLGGLGGGIPNMNDLMKMMGGLGGGAGR